MSQTTDKPPTLGAHAEASNRVQQPLLNRVLARPEIGALVAAVVIGIFFLIVAPGVRGDDVRAPMR
jgi:simple sugar transport system permease protein